MIGDGRAPGGGGPRGPPVFRGTGRGRRRAPGRTAAEHNVPSRATRRARPARWRSGAGGGPRRRRRWSRGPQRRPRMAAAQASCQVGDEDSPGDAVHGQVVDGEEEAAWRRRVSGARGPRASDPPGFRRPGPASQPLHRLGGRIGSDPLRGDRSGAQSRAAIGAGSGRRARRPVRRRSGGAGRRGGRSQGGVRPGCPRSRDRTGQQHGDGWWKRPIGPAGSRNQRGSA